MRSPAPPPRRGYIAFPYLPIDDVPQRVAGFGRGMGEVRVSLRPTADGTGVTGGAVYTTPPPIRVPGGSTSPATQPRAPYAALLQPKATLLTLSPLPSLPAPPAPVYAPQGGSAASSEPGSAGNKTALLVGAALLLVVVGAVVATRKKG